MNAVTFEQQAALQPAPFQGMDIEQARQCISGNVWYASNKVSTVPDAVVILDNPDEFLTTKMENPTFSVLLEPGYPEMDIYMEPPPYSAYELMDAGLMGAIDLDTSVDIYSFDGVLDSPFDNVVFSAPIEVGSTVTKSKRKKMSKSAPVF